MLSVHDAERELVTYRRVAGDRDPMVRRALAAGISKNRVHTLTGIARSTIDRITKEPTVSYTLVSASQGDVVPGVEISDPDAPLSWWDLPADAQEWASAQGYGEDEAELLYILGVEDDAPQGYPVLTVTLA